MKFKKLLAAILGALMITSCFSFTAGAQEADVDAAMEEIAVEVSEEVAEETEAEEAEEEAAEAPAEEAEVEEVAFEEENEEAALADETDTDTEGETEGTGIIKEFLLSKNLSLLPGVQNVKSRTRMYDAKDNIAFVRITPNAGDVSAYVNHGGSDVPITTEQATANENYLVFYARTNLDNDPETEGVQMPAPAAMQYDSKWNPTPATAHNPDLTQVKEGFASTVTDEWQKFCFKMISKFSKDETDYILTNWNQIAFSPVGLRAVMSGDKMYTLSDNPYYDVAGYTVVDSLDAALAYDFALEAQLPDVTTTFDLNYTGAPALTEAPTENPSREGIAFKGWSTNKYASSGEMDLTCLSATPTADTTYYAIWDNAAITFNRRNGAKNAAVTTLNVGVGEPVPFPENPTYMSHKFLGWSTEMNNKELIVDPATAVVTAEMVETGMTYYAVWESTHNSAEPVYFVTAQVYADKMAAENGTGTIHYDAENDIVYKHFVQNPDKTAGVRCNMYSLTADNLAYTTDSDTLYFVYFLRTNITGYKPYISFNSTTNKNGSSVSGQFSQSADKLNYTVTNAGETPEWQKITLTFSGMSELGIVDHMDFSAVGKSAVFADGEYFDIAAIAIFDNKEAAEAYDFDKLTKPATTVYLSSTVGNDSAAGIFADAPVATITKAQAIITANEKVTTLVIIDEYVYKSGATLGVAGREITVTGADADALFNFNDPAANDEILSLAGNVTFKNIRFNGSTNDGRIETRGHTFTFGEGFERIMGNGAGNPSNSAVAIGSNSDSTINIKGGTIVRLYPGNFNSGSYYKTATVNISGANTYVDTFALGHAYHAYTDYHGVIRANISDGATVNSLKVQANGSAVSARYSGLRYYTIDNATVNKIITTGRPKQTWTDGSTEAAAADRTGISVFEFNNGAKVTDSIAAGGGADSSTRIVIFNDGTTGNVTDTGAIVINVTNGTIKADVTATVPGNAKASAVLNGYTFTTDKANIYINGTNYPVSQFVEESGDAGLSADTVTGLIPASYFTAGNNTVVLSENDVVEVKWIVEGSTFKTELAEVGAKLTDPAASKAPDKNYYYTFKVWNDGTSDIDLATYTVPETGATLTAVFNNNDMADAVTLEYTTNLGHVQGSGIPPLMFTQAMETVGGINAVKIIPKADSPDDVAVEGYRKYPMNYSIGRSDASVNTDIYEYYVIRYYYEPGTNTDERKININVIGGGDGDVTEVTEPRKWSYAVGKFVAGKTTNQYHINVMRSSANGDIAASVLSANGEAIYLDKMVIFKTQPTIAEVKFTDENGDVLFAIEALNGEAVTYGGTAPEKANHTFKGWAIPGSDEIVTEFAFTENTTLVPVFEEIAVQYYTIKFVNEDATELQSSEVAYGETPVYTGETPTKAADAQYTYTFAGWTPEIAAVTGEATYTATYTSTVNKYTITFTDGENTYEVPTKYGETPVAPELTKTGYTLSWTPELAAVTGEATYEAVWTASKYNLIYTVDGEEYSNTEVAYGTEVTILASPEDRDGYTFSGWKIDDADAENFTMPAKDVEITGTWIANNYDVTYKVDGVIYSSKEVVYGTEVTILAAPEAREGYTFSGWKIEDADAENFTMPDKDVEIIGTWTVNNYTVTYKVDGEVYGEVENYDFGAAVIMREAPEKAGYTFSGWDKTLTTMPAENVEINGTFTKDEAPIPTTPTYKTYGEYDAINDKYTVKLMLIGAKVNQGSFGFEFPTSYMTFKSVTANAAAGIELLGDISPIYASGEGYYADTWAVADMDNAGHIDATAEEVLVATFEFTMSEEQREAFEAALADENYKFEEYVVENANSKYHNGTNYLVTPYSTGFDTTKAAVVYESHSDTEVSAKVEYTTYGKYDAYKNEYTIDIKVKGAKINLGAFGLAFNSDYMTFDPEVDEYDNAVNVTMADDVANYLHIILNNTADGYAFAWDGSSSQNGYVDASEEEVLIATIKLEMTPAQRAAFVEAGKPISLFVPTVNEDIDADTLAKYYDGENYLVSLYMPGLATPKVAAEYTSHTDEELPVTLADVEVSVEFTAKAEDGETAANIATIKLGDEAAIALEKVGDTANKASYTFKALTIGEKYTITVEKNGYLSGICEITVVAGTNTVEMKLLAGDIKGAETASCGDGTVNLDDFVRLIRAFDGEASDEFIATVDLDENGAVNVSDLAIIKANYNAVTADNTIIVNGAQVSPAA